MSKQAKKKAAPELVSRLIEVGIAELEGGGMAHDLAESHMKEISAKLCNEWGGGSIYVPRFLNFERDQRNAQIKAEFNGRNQADLARKFGLSVMSIYGILKET